MRELERDSLQDDPARRSDVSRALGRSQTASWALHGRNSPIVLAVVGGGRLGTALAAALDGLEQWQVAGPFGRGHDGAGADVVLLCVPDAEIANAVRLIVPGPLVGHCSGATGLDVLAPREAFSLHPLLPVVPGSTSFQGAGAAIAGSTSRSRALAASLAAALGMNAVEIDDKDRPAYHAAASIASNFLITLQSAAERVGASAGVSRELLVPLVRATVDNWAALGPERALTGPVARGDEATVATQRAAIEARAPELLALFDELVEATRALAARPDTKPELRATEAALA